jgi:hypothetical protein
MVTGKDWEDQMFDWPGFHPKDPLPFPGLGEIGRFWQDLEAPGQVVTMQLMHDKDLEARFFGRHNLWLLWVLSTVFPLGVPLIVTPAVETFFAAELVRAAIPGLVESNRSLGLAALVASEGLEMTDNLQYADTPHLASLVRAARVREGQTEGGRGGRKTKRRLPACYTSPSSCGGDGRRARWLRLLRGRSSNSSTALPTSPGRRKRARGTRRARRGARARGGAQRRVLSRF